MSSSAAPLPSREQILEALVKKQGSSAVKKLQRATIAVCGLGGLGSNIAISLARAGVGKLILIDFDKVDITNLHRQQYKMNQVGMIAPYVQYEVHQERVTAENVVSLLEGADIVCEAFDKADAKAMLVDTVLEQLPQKYLVAASGMASYDSGNSIKTRKITDRFYLCGDGQNDVDEVVGLVAPRVMLCAAHQALTAIRLVLGLE